MIQMCDLSGLVYDLTIAEFIIVQTARALIAEGIEANGEAVLKALPAVVPVLIRDGWITVDEYVGAVAEYQSQFIDEEYKQLLQQEEDGSE